MTRPMTEAEYRAHPALNWSRLRRIRQSPQHFAAGDVAVEDTPALRLGRAAHVATLEPEAYAARYTTWDGGRRAGKAWESFAEGAAAAGVEVLTADEAAQVAALATAVRTHTGAASLLREGRAEVPLFWEVDGRPCKARLDYVAEAMGGTVVVDLKTAADASPGGFGRACAQSGYLGQAAWYCDAVEALTGEAPSFAFVVVEKTPPFAVGVYAVDEVQLDVGRRLYRRLLRRVRECEERNEWPGYSSGVGLLEIPAWAYGEGGES